MAFVEDQTLEAKTDVWIHKNRMSGSELLEKGDVKTLLFAGDNTDQCVGGSLQDAFTKGWDCILIKDAWGTTSPEFASRCVEYNWAKNWGFVIDCDRLSAGVQDMLNASM